MKLQLICFLLLIFSNPLNAQKLFRLDPAYKSYEIKGLIIPNFVCEYYNKIGALPQSKSDFENYLRAQETDLGLLEAIEPHQYSFLYDQAKDELIFYDWGLDKTDDSLKITYTFFDRSITKDTKGDILIITTSLEDCRSQVRAAKRKFYLFSQQEWLYDEGRLVASQIGEIVGPFVEQLLSDEDLDELYPKKGEVRKLSRLYAVLQQGKWELLVIEREHPETEINQLLPLVKNWLDTAAILIERNIDELVIPVQYFTRDQLEKIKE